jgi:hypothetical protein
MPVGWYLTPGLFRLGWWQGSQPPPWRFQSPGATTFERALVYFDQLPIRGPQWWAGAFWRENRSNHPPLWV